MNYRGVFWNIVINVLKVIGLNFGELDLVVYV